MGRGWLSSCELLGDDDRFELETLLGLLDAVEAKIEAVENRLADLAFRDLRAPLLMTIPGVDYPVAMSLLAAIGDVSRFPSPQKLASYLGLVPRVKQSAAKCWTGPITKQGRSQARWMAVEAAQHLARA